MDINKKERMYINHVSKELLAERFENDYSAKGKPDIS
jgi:hypothetical protein